jgi:hypothetical protein
VLFPSRTEFAESLMSENGHGVPPSDSADTF